MLPPPGIVTLCHCLRKATSHTSTVCVQQIKVFIYVHVNVCTRLRPMYIEDKEYQFPSEAVHISLKMATSGFVLCCIFLGASKVN